MTGVIANFASMSDDKTKTSAKVAFTMFLKSKKLRKTYERYAILDMVYDMTDHFDIESLYSALESSSHHVSRATVYNTIQLLVESGLVRRHQFGNQPAQYERVIGQRMGNHHHLICTECGKVKEVKDVELIRRLGQIKYPTFQTEYFALYVYGICSRCQKRLKKERK